MASLDPIVLTAFLQNTVPMSDLVRPDPRYPVSCIKCSDCDIAYIIHRVRAYSTHLMV
jgi:hypothetical protein